MPSPSDEQKKLQLQAYVAEYQAMMSRTTWFMSLEFSALLPIIGFFTAYRYIDPNLVAWWLALTVQSTLLVYCFALHEVFNNVLYIEAKLKPKVSVLLKLSANQFWGWERHLKQSGKANDPGIFDKIPATISVFAFLAASFVAVYKAYPSGWDCLGAVVSGCLSINAVGIARRIGKVRKALGGSCITSQPTGPAA